MANSSEGPEAIPSSSSPPLRTSASSTSTRTRTRKAGEVRSRSGCLTCKQRRKKCDEDFRLRSNGAMACTRCSDRRIDCEMSTTVTPARHSPYPASSSQSKPLHRGVRAASTVQPSSTQTISEPTASLTAALDPTQPWTSSQYHSQHQQQAVFQNPVFSSQMSWLTPGGPAAHNHSAMRYNRPNVWPSSNSTNAPGFDPAPMPMPNSNNSAHAPADMNAFYNFMNGSGAAPVPPVASQWNQAYPNSVDNMMLDDFVNELMSLTGPLVGNQGASAASTVATPVAPNVVISPSIPRTKDDSIPTAHPAAIHPADANVSATSGNGTSSGRHRQPSRSSQQYQNLLASDAIESLLSKYSPIYEHFWHATLLVLSAKRRQAAVDYLMGVIRSNKACRASVVVVCLAYHELVQRVRKEALKTRSSQTRGNAQPANWTTLASESFKQHQTPLADHNDLSHPILTMFPDSMMEQPKRSRRGQDAEQSSSEESHDDAAQDGSRKSGQDKSTESGRKKASSSRKMAGKLSTDDPAKDTFKGEKVQDLAVELWFDIARVELDRSRDDLTLEQEVCAVINLRWACLCFAGTERTRQLTEELGRVIQRSGIDLEHMVEEERKGSLVSIMLQTAVYTDILDSACERGKRASVPLRNESGRMSHPQLVSRQRYGAVGADDAPLFGKVSLLSLELLTCFKMISDLAADVWGPIGEASNAGVRSSDEEVASRSRELERKILSLPAWSDPHTSSSFRVRAFSLQEIWRQTARLYMLQSVHRRGPLHPELQAILHEIIRLAKMIKFQSLPPYLPAATVTHYTQPLSSSNRGAKSATRAPTDYVGGLRSSNDPYQTTSYTRQPHPRSDTRLNDDEDSLDAASPDSGSDNSVPPAQPAAAGQPPFHPFQMWLDVASWEMCTVWFLCSTVAVTSADRQFCIHHLDSLGLERANRDNVQVIRDFWAQQDETGHSLDWFDFVKSSGRCVVFAF